MSFVLQCEPGGVRVCGGRARLRVQEDYQDWAIHATFQPPRRSAVIVGGALKWRPPPMEV